MPDKRDRIGDFWISPHPRSGVLCRTWYDERSRQTRRVTLATRDSEEARTQLAAWYAGHRELRNEAPGAIALDLILARYYEEWGRHRPSWRNIKRSLALWSEFHQGKSVADLTPAAHDRFVAWLKAHGFAIGYVSSVLAHGRAALNRSRKRGELAMVPFVPDVQTAADKLDKEPKGRPLSQDEMASLIEHAEPPWMRLFIVIAGNTLARPDAILALTPFQYERDAGVLKLNPAGRQQTKKRRPTIPVTATLAAWLASTNGERYLSNQVGGPIHKTTLRRAWLRTAKAADLTGTAPYSIRHTLARHLVSQGVPEDQVSGFLGHQRSSTTRIYAPYAPGYLADAATAIDAYWTEVFAILRRRGVSLALQGRVTGGVKLLSGLGK